MADTNGSVSKAKLLERDYVLTEWEQNQLAFPFSNVFQSIANANRGA